MFSPDNISNWIQHLVVDGLCTRCGQRIEGTGVVYRKREGHMLTLTPSHYKLCQVEAS